MRATEWIVIREVKTNECRLSRVVVGYRPKPERGFSWGGPFPSERAAREALSRADEPLGRQLYPEGFQVA